MRIVPNCCQYTVYIYILCISSHCILSTLWSNRAARFPGFLFILIMFNLKSLELISVYTCCTGTGTVHNIARRYKTFGDWNLGPIAMISHDWFLAAPLRSWHTYAIYRISLPSHIFVWPCRYFFTLNATMRHASIFGASFLHRSLVDLWNIAQKSLVRYFK